MGKCNITKFYIRVLRSNITWRQHKIQVTTVISVGVCSFMTLDISFYVLILSQLLKLQPTV